MLRIRNLALVALLVPALTATVGLGVADAKKKKKKVTSVVTMTMTYEERDGTDRFYGTIFSANPKCVRFAPVELHYSQSISTAGPFTPSTKLTGAAADVSGTYQILYEPTIGLVGPGFDTLKFETKIAERIFKTKKKRITCTPALSPPQFFFA